jgi:multicomponent Na+:H+ antiporter subunit G
MIALFLVALVLAAIGIFMCVVGSIGLLRMPDVYNRIHSATVITWGVIVGMLSIFFGVLAIPVSNTLIYCIKCLLMIFFILIASPTESHAIARAARKSGVDLDSLKADFYKEEVNDTN